MHFYSNNGVVVPVVRSCFHSTRDFILLSYFHGTSLTEIISTSIIPVVEKKLAYFFLSSSSSWKSFLKLVSKGSVSLQILVCVFKVFLGLFSKTC